MTPHAIRSILSTFALGCVLLLTARVAPAAEKSLLEKSVVASFIVVGDNQLGAEHIPPGEPTSANVAQLRQTLKDISTLDPQPSQVFFVGDMVLNRDGDAPSELAARLAAWTDLYRASAREFGFAAPAVPVPGNKDIMRVVFQDGTPVEALDAEAIPVWTRWLQQSRFGRFGGNGPSAAAPNPDRLAADNSRLTYSFDDAAGNHFILIDTFTRNNQPEPPRGWIPYHWIAEDARRAEANPRVRHIFAFGHMPIRIAGLPFDPTGANSILNSSEFPLAQQLQRTFGGLRKFGGYFCGHLHLWDCSRLPDSQDVWQVIGGNSGSKPIARAAGAWQPPFFFGFNCVRVHRDGRVGVVSYRRPVPEPYYSTGPQPAAQPTPEIFLTRAASGGAPPSREQP